ncbi:MAG: transketolase C-terminal domain-containing protein [Lachnospiraceae bacterium]|nr:transketolase C-terminal domain-containing protein [Lachnospiraceae bacterium]
MAGSFNFGEWISARTVIGSTLYEIGKTNEKLFVCTPDVGMSLIEFQEAFPERYVDVGIAEQNVIGVAAGLALDGNIPVVMGMLPFLSMRACEQVRTAVCYQNLPVRIIGTGGGLTSGGGSTHNAMEDIAIEKSFVNMQVISICDPNMIRDILMLSMDVPGPMYIRLAQGKKDRQLYEPGTIQFKIGGSVTCVEGNDCTILAHGEMVGMAIDVAEAMKEEGISVRVIDCYSIKPWDKEAVQKAIDETGNIIVWEDHLMEGGFASTIADYIVDNAVPVKSFKRFGVPQVYAGFGSGEEQQIKYGYHKKDVSEYIRSICR